MVLPRKTMVLPRESPWFNLEKPMVLPTFYQQPVVSDKTSAVVLQVFEVLEKEISKEQFQTQETLGLFGFSKTRKTREILRSIVKRF